MENGLEGNKTEAGDLERATAKNRVSIKFMPVIYPHSSLTLGRPEHLYNPQGPNCFYVQGKVI